MGLENTGRNKRKATRNYRQHGKVHLYDGFPHYTTLYPVPHCICLQECCHSWEEGCICLTCPCRHGIPHGIHHLKEA